MRAFLSVAVMMAIVFGTVVAFGFPGLLVGWAIAVGTQVVYAMVRYRASDWGLGLARLLTVALACSLTTKILPGRMFEGRDRDGDSWESAVFFIVWVLLCAASWGAWRVLWRRLLGPGIARRMIRGHRPELARLLAHGPYGSLRPGGWGRPLAAPRYGLRPPSGPAGQDEEREPSRPMAYIYCRRYRWDRSDPSSSDWVVYGYALAAVFPRPPSGAQAACMEGRAAGREGHVFLLRDPAGAYFAEHQYRLGTRWFVRLVLLTREMAMSMYDELPQKGLTAEDAFPDVPGMP